ncbi:hypothetical protein C1H57_12360 [Clostridium sp. 2-1]|uniref:hypothetical protein n=1 Tax=Clostridium TaxID=1485 RepID=UPI000CDA1BA5|nr:MULTISPECIES: hypothetical protein [Clostridium]MBN7576043.1 hypothetical protein [Clostridium beijerinckii]MBN7581124.1 hypothetical protein [Clostridium beijerinckii]MBN7585764.1 hypothetical protein [Clostridium beijerinckii]MBO0521553.1 hypothetical protein [Clostridium beijerinckii]POO90976.1 hypothetical protein C1H57_12360 [Clostridium sp. 2-1]
MERNIYKTNNEYILDVLEEEEERLLDILGSILIGEDKYLFYRYISIRDTIDDIKSNKAI